MVEEGVQAKTRSNKLWSICSFILVVEACERLCYYSIGGTMRNYLTLIPEKYSQGQAGAINSSFTMLSYLSCFLGGYLADNWLGRFKTILIFATAYFVGTVCVAVAAVPGFYNLALYFVGTMVLISIGTGAIKPNVMNFGASQYDENDPAEKSEQKAFFSYFYMMINLGAGVSYGFLCSVATSQAQGPGQPGDGFVITYCIAAGAMGLAVFFFLLGSRRYKPEEATVHKPMVSVLVKYLFRSCKSVNGFCAILGWMLIPPYLVLNLMGSIISSDVSKTLTNIAMYLCIASCVLLVIGHLRNGWIQEFREPILGSGISVEDARKTMALVPQLLLINLGFNICYNAMNNAYPAQACQMDLRVFGTQLNGAFASLGDCIAILVGVPIIEGCIFPFLEKRRGKHISRRSKYISGFIIAILANGSAVGVEFLRRQAPFIEGDDGISKCAPGMSPPIHMSDISCFLAFVPMILTGIAEILVNPVVYQFAFESAPSQLMSVVQAFNLVVAGALSNCITGPLSNAIFPDNLNQPTDPHWSQSNTTDHNAIIHNWVGRAAGGCGGESPSDLTGCGDVNKTFIVNMIIGVACLVAYMLVEKFDEVEPENLTLREGSSRSHSFIAAGERDARVVE